MIYMLYFGYFKVQNEIDKSMLVLSMDGLGVTVWLLIIAFPMSIISALLVLTQNKILTSFHTKMTFHSLLTYYPIVMVIISLIFLCALFCSFLGLK